MIYRKKFEKKISKFGKLFSDPKGGPFASKKIEIFWKKNYPLKSFEMTQKGILKQKSEKFFLKFFEVFKSSIEPPSGFEIMKFC